VGSDFSNYQIYAGAECDTARANLLETIDSAMKSEGLTKVEASHETIVSLLEADHTSRCFAVSPAHSWITVLDSLPSVYGEPGYIEAIARKKRGGIPQIQEPDIEGEKFRQEKCLSFLANLSKHFPTIWLKIFDSCELEASLFLDGKQVGTFVYPWDYRAENPVALMLESNIDWPEVAGLPLSEIEFWESSEHVARGRKFSALAKHVGWRPESVELGFTVDSEGTNFWYAVPDDYTLLCYSKQYY
jgi:hypothetical protein